MDIPRLDRNAFSISTLDAPCDAPAYWAGKSPDERLAALEFLRQQMYDYDPATTRLQRFLEVARREPG